MQRNNYINNIICPEESIKKLFVKFEDIFENKTREYKNLVTNLEIN